MPKEKTGKIQVIVQTAARLNAITELAQAVNKLAEALNAGTQVIITDCFFASNDPGITIVPAKEVCETMIKEILAASGGDGGGTETDEEARLRRDASGI